MHQMGVTIDEAGRDPAAIKIDVFGSSCRVRQIVHRPHPGDALAFCEDGATVDDAQAGLARVEGGDAGIGPEPRHGPVLLRQAA